jgi:hypothetical protein
MRYQQREANLYGTCTPVDGNIYTNGTVHTADGGYSGKPNQTFTIICGAYWSLDDNLEIDNSTDLFDCTNKCVAYNTADNGCCTAGTCVGVSYSPHKIASQCVLHAVMAGPARPAATPLDSARLTDFVPTDTLYPFPANCRILQNR